MGKSTIAVNVACGLARRGPERVVLIDGSLQMGVCATLLDLRPQTTMTDAAQERGRLDEVLLRQLTTAHACGLHLLAAPRDAVEAAMIDDEIISRIVTLARRTYDYVIVDSFPMLDRVVMAVLDLSDRAYIVIESVVPTLLGGAKFLKLLGDLGVPQDRIRVIVNRYMNFAGNLKPADVSTTTGSCRRSRHSLRQVCHRVGERGPAVAACGRGDSAVSTARSPGSSTTCRACTSRTTIARNGEQRCRPRAGSFVS